MKIGVTKTDFQAFGTCPDESSSFQSPFYPVSILLGFASKIELLVKTGIQCYPKVCKFFCLHPNQAHDVTQTSLLVKTTEGNNSLLPLLVKLIRPVRLVRPPNVCLMSHPPPALYNYSNQLRTGCEFFRCH